MDVRPGSAAEQGVNDSSLDEFGIIRRFFSKLGGGDAVDVGIGDDCALLAVPEGQRLAVSVDTLVAGTHFPGEARPGDIGYRAVAVAMSDLAAVGAEPLGITLAVTLPAIDQDWLQEFSDGVSDALEACSTVLVGGDTTRGPLAVSVQVLGAVPVASALLRSGARAGDAVFVSGPLGDAAAMLAARRGEWRGSAAERAYLERRFYRPRARLELGRKLRGLATAAVDVSDGLVADAGHIAAASGVAIHLDSESLPLSSAVVAGASPETALQWALTGGDDYELCFTLPAQSVAPRGCTRVGEVRPGSGVHCDVACAGAGGYRHF